MFEKSSFFTALLLAALFFTAFGGAPAVAQTSASPDVAADDAQEEAPSREFSAALDVRVVNVEVFVTDRRREPIEGLTQADFELRVDGKPMPISNFYAEAGGETKETIEALEEREDTAFRPLEKVSLDSENRAHVVVLIDHTRLRTSHRKRAFNALREAIARFDDDDLIAVVGIEGGLVFYSDFLFDRQALGEILDDASKVAGKQDISEMERRRLYGELARGQSGGFLAQDNISQGDVIARIRAYSQEEFNRSLVSLKQIESVVGTLSGIPGRKAVLYLGEGIPTRPGEGLWVEYRNRFGSSERGVRNYDFNTNYSRTIGNFDLEPHLEDVALAANEAGVTLYAVDADGNQGNDVRSALTEQGATSETISVVADNYREPLEFATKATGGRLLRSSGKLADQLAVLTRDFNTFYSLGFNAPADWEPGSTHTIDVKVAGNGRLVRHRTEVRLPKADEQEAGATVAALMYQSVSNPLGIKANPGSEAPRADGETAALPVQLEIPVGKLAMLPEGDVYAASVTIFVSVKDEKGNPGAVQKIPFHLNIPADKIEEARANSAHYPLPLVLRRGDQQAAISVRDDIDGRISTVRIDVSQFSQAF